jgi:hypothetical protein
MAEALLEPCFMKNLGWRSSWLAAGFLVAAGACGGNNLGHNEGTGGSRGYGGAGTGGLSTGGWFGTTGGVVGEDNFGGTYNTGGALGYGGSFPGTGGAWPGTGGVTGAGGAVTAPDGGVCSAGSPGPLSTQDPPRPFGWTFTGTSGSGSSDAGDDWARCQTIVAAYPGTRCVGFAHMQLIAGQPVITFVDGSQLAWDGTLPSSLAPFVMYGGNGDSVWVDYEKSTVVVCPFCGSYTDHTLMIWDSPDGRVRFYDQQGDVLTSVAGQQVTDIFGTSSTPIQTCTYPQYAGCYQFLRSEYDQQLATSPPQIIRDATLTKVTAPKGQFMVFWATSMEWYPTRLDGCSNGPGVASDNGFVAALMAPSQ